MTISQLNRRLEGIEAAVSTIPKSCYVCRDWPEFIMFFEEPDGTRPEWKYAWPQDPIECPNCGRGPERVVVITVRPDGPQ